MSKLRASIRIVIDKVTFSYIFWLKIYIFIVACAIIV